MKNALSFHASIRPGGRIGERLRMVKSIVLTAVYSLLLTISGQILHAQERCGTTGGPGSVGYIAIPSNNFSPQDDAPIFIRVYVHVIGKDDGSGAPTLAQVKISMEKLRDDFKTHNIYFVQECGLIPINNTALYNANDLSHPNCNLTQYSNHPDGIDIFIGGDDALGVNAASGIPGKSFIIKGSIYGDTQYCTPALQWVNSRSHTFSHEMGHCLGLWHTHHGIEIGGVDCNGNLADPNVHEDLVDSVGDNTTTGDYIADTPPDPKMFGCTPNIYNNCVYNLGAKDSDSTLYDPDETLIMSYSHDKCMNKFTTDQATRMRTMIQTVSPVLQACVVHPDYSGQQTINNSTTWSPSNTPNNGDIRIEGDLVIESGATLTIQAGVTVHFGQDNRVIIKPNARLVLHGTLTSRGCNSYAWKGVQVWGSGSGQSQYAVNGVYAQGRIQCRPGALIENAEIGVQLFGPNAGMSGGQISCDGATIKNCAIGVDFSEYHNYWPYPTPQQNQPRNYAASFFSTAFLVDDSNAFSSVTVMASLKGVNGVLFSGCDFRNTRDKVENSENPADKGIYAFDAGFSVIARGEGDTYPYSSYKHTTFTGLGYGIYTTKGTDGKPYIVKQAVFEDCGVGIRNVQVAGATILFNTFLLGKVPYIYVPIIDIGEPGEPIDTLAPPNQYGVVFESAVAGFTCQENLFMNKYGSEELKTVGVFCKNMGFSNKTIRKNTFNGLNIGNLSNENNGLSMSGMAQGLYYDCNINLNVLDNDFSVPNGTIRPKQGLEVSSQGGITYNAAGNKFSYTGVDFSNLGSSIDYYFDPNGQNEEPVVFEGYLNKIPSSPNTCATTFCEPPCKSKEEIATIKNSYFQKRKEFQNIKSEYNIEPTEARVRAMSYYQRSMDDDAYMVVVHALYDTADFQLDTLLAWIGNLGSPESDLWLSDKRLAVGDYAPAISILTELSTKYALDSEKSADIENYKSLTDLLNGQTLYSLDKSMLETLENYRKTDGYARVWAENILNLYGAHFPVTCVLGEGTQERARKEEPNKKSQQLATVHPNPASDYVQFSFLLPKDSEAASIVITDLHGRSVKKLEYHAPEGMTTWETNDYPGGIYFYRIVLDGVIKQSGKIVLSK